MRAGGGCWGCRSRRAPDSAALGGSYLMRAVVCCGAWWASPQCPRTLFCGHCGQGDLVGRSRPPRTARSPASASGLCARSLPRPSGPLLAVTPTMSRSKRAFLCQRALLSDPTTFVLSLGFWLGWSAWASAGLSWPGFAAGLLEPPTPMAECCLLSLSLIVLLPWVSSVLAS